MSYSKTYTESPKRRRMRAIRDKTRYAIKKGIIEKREICEICKINKSEQIHHNDYSNYQDIKFLCIDCHKNCHIEKYKRIKLYIMLDNTVYYFYNDLDKS